MEEKTKKVIVWIVALIVGVGVFFAVRGCFNQSYYNYSQSGFKVQKEEFCYTYDEYYTGDNAFPDKCPAVKLTIKNTSEKSLYVYGQVNFYKDGSLFKTAYLSTATLAPNDVVVETVSSIDGVRWNSFDSYNWTYKIVSIKCNYV